MDGYKTQLIAAVGAILSALTAFGLDLSPEQKEAVLTLAATVVWPLAMIAMRALTRGPMKNPVTGESVRGKLHSPWWVIVLLLPLLWLGGCASTSFNDAMGAAYLTRTTLAESITAECGNTVPDGPCLPSSAISTDQKQRAKAALVLAGSYLADARAVAAGRAGLSCSDPWECLEAAHGVLGVVERMLEEGE